MNKSIKQIQLEERILKLLTGKPLKAMELLFTDPEIQALQEYANIVSIKRLVQRSRPCAHAQGYYEHHQNVQPAQ